MSSEDTVLSVVCARAGSKGLKNKCIIELAGKPVAEYAIEYSLSLGKGVRTVVSTDIEELIRLCRQKGIPCIERAPALCADESRIDGALADALEKFGADCKFCSLVYGNIPTRYPRLFVEALGSLRADASYDAAISMQMVEKFHPDWMFDYNTESLPKMKEAHYRRQMLAPKMIHDGHTLLFRSGPFMDRYKGRRPYDKDRRYSTYGDRIKPLINEEVIIDIDTVKDLELASAVISGREKGNRP